MAVVRPGFGLRSVPGACLLSAAAFAGTSPSAADAQMGDAPIVVVGRRPAPAPYAGTPLAEAALARMRGGLMLPNGLNISIGIDIQTRVDGLLALHSIYSTDGPSAGVRVFTDGADSVRTAPGTLTVETGAGDAAPTVTLTRAPTGSTIEPGGSSMPATVNILSGAPATWLQAVGETQVPVTDNGSGVATARGEIRLASDDRGATVTLVAPDLQIQQLIGQATGVVIANSGSDRTIDTISSINLDLSGLPSQLAASLALSDALALDFATSR